MRTHLSNGGKYGQGIGLHKRQLIESDIDSGHNHMSQQPSEGRACVLTVITIDFLLFFVTCVRNMGYKSASAHTRGHAHHIHP